MADLLAGIFLGPPMACVVLAFGWIEVTRLRAITAVSVAAIEARKQVEIVRAQARGAPAEATGEGGEP